MKYSDIPNTHLIILACLFLVASKAVLLDLGPRMIQDAVSGNYNVAFATLKHGNQIKKTKPWLHIH